jgi:hypothetical protein
MQQNLIRTILCSPPAEAWQTILEILWDLMAQPMHAELPDLSIIERDRNIGEIDNFLCGSAWELWNDLLSSPLRASAQLKNFWSKNNTGKAVLILDALSLREAPWILEGARQRGYKVERSLAAISELPGDTFTFAKALGFTGRSALSNNAGKSLFFPNAWTESVGLPFSDCIPMVRSEPAIIFWHHWPDSAVHKYSEDGFGLRNLVQEMQTKLTGDDFWEFVDRLTTGRTLIITGDHGYADSGLFHLLPDKAQNDFMKNLFRSGRAITHRADDDHCWVPPLTLEQDGQTLALGRRKWKSQGGYPTLVHGGLSLLEVLVPYIEIRK